MSKPPEFRMSLGSGLPPTRMPTGRETGKVFGRLLFELVTLGMAEAVASQRKAEFEPEAAGNIPAVLEAYRAATIFAAVARYYGGVSEPGGDQVGHWRAARAEFGVGVLEVIDGVLADAEEALGPNSNLTTGIRDDLEAVVMAFVFPELQTDPKSESWKADKVETFEAIRQALRDVRGFGDE